MNKLKNIQSGFTLIEMIVAITIFMIIILSVSTIFVSSSDISKKADINRSMQENMKNVVEIISEDIRQNGILGVSDDIINSCGFNENMGNFYTPGDKLCTGLNDYYLANKNESGNYVRVDESNCENINDNCVIYQYPNGPITNSLVTVKDLKFYTSREGSKKVTLSITLQPSIKNGVRPNLINNNVMIFETTISEKPF